MKEKIEQEHKNLEYYEDLITKLVQEHAKANRSSLDPFRERNLLQLVSRSVLAEKEFLHSCPEDYFDLYGQDHLLN